MFDIMLCPPSTAYLRYELKVVRAEYVENVKLTGLFITTKGIKHMSQTWRSNSSDSHEIHQGDYPPASPCDVLDHVYPSVDPVVLAQKNNGVIASGPRIVLTCGPYDDEEDDR